MFTEFYWVAMSLWFSFLRGQDIDRGNVDEACNSVLLTDRAEFDPHNLPAGKCMN